MCNVQSDRICVCAHIICTSWSAYTDTAMHTHSVSLKNWEGSECIRHREGVQDEAESWCCTESLMWQKSANMLIMHALHWAAHL